MTGSGLILWRESHGFSQLELAQQLRTSIDTIVQWERMTGRSLPTYLEVTLRGMEKRIKEEKDQATD